MNAERSGPSHRLSMSSPRTFTFTQKRPVVSATVVGEPATAEAIEATPVLRRPSLETAVQFGGPVVRRLLEQVPLRGDRSYVTVDTKVTLLMPGWYPAIPGWHTDGVPRGTDLSPDGKGAPRLDEQVDMGEGPRYHVISVGLDSPTEFIDQTFDLEMEHYDSTQLYAELTRKVETLVQNGDLSTVAVSDRWVSWDWWNVHRAIPATATGWRLLIRVTESDQLKPRTADFIRAQSQVYVPVEFGW